MQHCCEELAEGYKHGRTKQNSWAQNIVIETTVSQPVVWQQLFLHTAALLPKPAVLWLRCSLIVTAQLRVNKLKVLLLVLEWEQGTWAEQGSGHVNCYPHQCLNNYLLDYTLNRKGGQKLKYRGNTKLLLKCISSNINYTIEDEQTKLEGTDIFSTDNSEKRCF